VRNSGLVGHLEDIAVSKSMQGRKLGLKIINTLEEVGRGQGVYKIILDCSKENIRESSWSIGLGVQLIFQPSTRSAGT
jgi:GNAT superfamily N-acetyltransferase